MRQQQSSASGGKGLGIRTVGILHGRNLLVVIKIVEERGENPPTRVKFVVTYKVGVVAFQRVENQRFIGFWNLQIGETSAVSEVELRDHGLHAQSRQLRVHLDVN